MDKNYLFILISILLTLLTNQSSSSAQVKILSNDGKVKKSMDRDLSKTHKTMTNTHGGVYKKGDSVYSRFFVTGNRNTSEANFVLVPGDRGYGSPLKCESYLDVCGECGSSVVSKLDLCNVCRGNNRCKSCDESRPGSQRDACSKCLLPQDHSWNDCERIVSVHPAVLDKAVGAEGELKVELTTAPADANHIRCSIIQSASITVNIEKTSLEDTWLVLTVPLNQLTGECRLQCLGTADSHNWGVRNLTIVDSRSLSISAVSPSSFTLGASVQLKLVVHGVSSLVDLYCVIMSANRSILSVKPTDQMMGNPMSSTVTCPHVTLTSDAARSVGVVFTRSAATTISLNRTSNVVVQPAPIKPLLAYFSEDLRHIVVEFNQNIGGSSNCSSVFRASSFDTLGTGVECDYLSNKLLVKLGAGAEVQPRHMLRFSRSTSLRQVGSSAQNKLTKDSVLITVSQSAYPQYVLVGASKLCSTAASPSTRVVALSGHALRYNWTLLVTEADNRTVEASGARQRRNLLVWFGAREMIRPARVAHVDELQINASLMVPDINYHLEVVGYNSAGLVGQPARLTMRLTNFTTRNVEMLILSPTRSYVNSPLRLEAKVFDSCANVSLNTVKYIWKAVTENHVVNVASGSASVSIPAGSLRVFQLYNIQCEMVNSSIVIAKGEAQVLIEPGKIDLYIEPVAIVLGTGHNIVLDVSKSFFNMNISDIQFQWSCLWEGSHPCLSPGSNQLLSSSHPAALLKSKLLLPPGSLPVGKYKFKVEASLGKIVYSATACVEVVGGHPPLLSLQTPNFSLTQGLSLAADASDLEPGCLLFWDSVPLVGYQTVPLNNVSGSTQVVSSDSFVTSRDCSIVIPAALLEAGCRYRLQLTAECSAARYAYAATSAYVPSFPYTANLEVRPLQGIALETLFTFSTKHSELSEVTYSFGFYSASGQPYFFYSSAYSLTYQTTLPALGAGSQELRTVLRVCSSQLLCTSTDGPTLHITLPAALSTQQISAISSKLSRTLLMEDVAVAVAAAVSVLSTTKQLSDQTAYNSVSAHLIAAILKRINETSSRLEEDPLTRPEAILLLDSVTKLLPLLRLNDSALLQIVAFRDKIASKRQPPPDRPSRVLEQQLVMEPRTPRFKRQSPIPTTTVPETPETVMIWLRTSESAILSLSAERSLRERTKLLTNLDNYVAGLCDGLTHTTPVYLDSQVVSLSVQKLSVSASYKIQLPVPTCPHNCPTPSAKLILGRTFASEYKMADSVCLSGLQFPIKSLDAVFKPPSTMLPLSAVYRLKVLLFTSASFLLSARQAPLVTIVIPVQTPDHSTLPEHVVKCFANSDGKWNAEDCKTSKIMADFVTCQCPAYKYYSVFAVSLSTTTVSTTASTTEVAPSITTSTTSSPTTTTSATAKPSVDAISHTLTDVTTTSTTTQLSSTSTHVPIPAKMMSNKQPIKKVAFRIAENFDATVKNMSVDFCKLIKKQVVQQLNLPKGIVKDIYITKGSILVTLSLQNTEKLSVDECIAELSQALGEGQLNLRGPENKPLDVPRQPLQVLKDMADHKSELPTVFLASASVGVCILVAVYVVLVTVITKHTRQKQASRIAQRIASVDSTVPKYLPLPFPHTLEGPGHRITKLSVDQGEDLDSGISDSGGLKNN